MGSLEYIAIEPVQFTPMDLVAAKYAHVKMMLSVIRPTAHALALLGGWVQTAPSPVNKGCMEKTANTSVTVKMEQSVIQPQANVIVHLAGLEYFVTLDVLRAHLEQNVRRNVIVLMGDLVTISQGNVSVQQDSKALSVRSLAKLASLASIVSIPVNAIRSSLRDVMQLLANVSVRLDGGERSAIQSVRKAFGVSSVQTSANVPMALVTQKQAVAFVPLDLLALSVTCPAPKDIMVEDVTRSAQDAIQLQMNVIQ